MNAFSLGDVPVRSVGLAPPLIDEPPLLDGEPEFSCEGCGTALEYAGRGRKPKWCANCKSSSPRKLRSVPTGSNDKLAGMATDLLCQANNMAGVGFMLFQLNGTAMALAAREDAFRIQAYEALKTDPALCKMILKGGSTSGKIMLVVAYAMLAVSIAPVAIEEIKEKRAAKAEANSEETEG